MALEYKIKVDTRPSGEEIQLRIRIGRSEDSGDTFKEVAVFASTHKAAIADSIIITEIDRKVKEYVRADADRIDKALITERAAALVEALDGRSYTP